MIEKGYDEKYIVGNLKKDEDRFTKIITCGTVSFARIVRSAINCLEEE